MASFVCRFWPSRRTADHRALALVWRARSLSQKTWGDPTRFDDGATRRVAPGRRAGRHHRRAHAYEVARRARRGARRGWARARRLPSDKASAAPLCRSAVERRAESWTT